MEKWICTFTAVPNCRTCTAIYFLKKCHPVRPIRVYTLIEFQKMFLESIVFNIFTHFRMTKIHPVWLLRSIRLLDFRKILLKLSLKNLYILRITHKKHYMLFDATFLTPCTFIESLYVNWFLEKLSAYISLLRGVRLLGTLEYVRINRHTCWTLL